MINIIRKSNIIKSEATISTRSIPVIETNNSIVLIDPVKNYIHISYDELGNPDSSFVDFGVQYDHRVTWLHFDLTKLLWNLVRDRSLSEEEMYRKFVFKLAFSRISTTETDTQVWSFDGYDFEIPRGITRKAGNYRMVLIIEESQEDDFVGNIKNEDQSYIERFVTKELKGKVTPTIFDPSYDLTVEEAETDQVASLTKPTIYCTLADNGEFVPETAELGQKFDNYVRYFKFNPRQITAHLNDFHTLAIFKQGESFYYSLFEKTFADDPEDDYSESHPIIAWIPSGVYQNSGTWQVAIISFTGNLEEMNDLEEINGDYYFYVSKTAKMKVVKNNLTFEDVSKEPIINITTNLLTEIGEIIITADNKVYQHKQ